MINVGFWMEKSRIKKEYDMGYNEFMKSMDGRHYRKWGKYDD